MTPAERSMRSRMGAYAMLARNDPRQTTKPGRAKFMARFEDEVDPDRSLPERERERRAEAAKKRYFTRLAYQSARSRSERKGSR